MIKNVSASQSSNIPQQYGDINLEQITDMLRFARGTECINATGAGETKWPWLDFPSETQTAADWKQAEVCL